jgi:very-short-patch-repair endonuclease
MKIHSRTYLKEKRSELRKNMSPPEARLWVELRNKKLKGYKFRRQHSIGNYIVDFYCSKAKLIIEIDGKTHLEPATQQNDFARDEYLKSMRYKVLRFDNNDILNQFEYVITDIENSLVERS